MCQWLITAQHNTAVAVPLKPKTTQFRSESMVILKIDL